MPTSAVDSCHRRRGRRLVPDLGVSRHLGCRRTGFSIFADTLLKMVGLHVPPVALFAICVATSWYCAWKNVQLSALLMLLFEGVSVALILVLCFIVLSQRHFAIDHAQFNVSKLPWSSVGLGVVVAIFSLVGFECATAFGDEAKIH